VEISEGEMTQ